MMYYHKPNSLPLLFVNEKYEFDLEIIILIIMIKAKLMNGELMQNELLIIITNLQSARYKNKFTLLVFHQKRLTIE